MKRIVSAAALLIAGVCCMAQYQLPNPGFEQWDGTSSTAEPTHWNSFASSEGSFASLASAPHHYHRNGGRPGTQGSSYLTIYTKSIVGVKANGNMTTGRIHAGSMSASSSDNYNYTQRSNSAHCQPFTGTPDSMVVWVSFYAGSASSQAQIGAYLHGDNDFRSPNDEATQSKYCGRAVARFARTTSSATSMHWQRVKVPFVYDGSSSANYMLVNITTNSTPGGGDANDSLSIDDIEFIYSAWLSGITVAGVPVEGFDKGTMEYQLSVDDLDADVSAVAEVSDAEVSIARETVDDTTVVVTIDVVAEDNTTMRQYRVTLTTGTPSVGIAPVMPARLQVYPNPATDAVTVCGDGLLKIIDQSGREVFSRTIHGTVRLSLEMLPAGVYTIRCGSRTSRLVRR